MRFTVAMTLDITVRGFAESTYPAERGTLALAVVLEGPDRDEVTSTAVDLHDQVTSQLEQLRERESVSQWSSDQVRVMSHRPYDEGRRQAPIHVTRVEVSAEFVDFERLSGFVDYWAGRDGVEVGGVAWDVAERDRRLFESEVRKAAVDDAVHKAQAYSDAVRRGKVTAYEIADPGMLAGGHDAGGGPQPMFARMASDVGGGAALTLTPAPIVIGVSVDARFTAG